MIAPSNAASTISSPPALLATVRINDPLGDRRRDADRDKRAQEVQAPRHDHRDHRLQRPGRDRRRHRVRGVMKAVSEVKRDGGHDHDHQEECRSHCEPQTSRSPRRWCQGDVTFGGALVRSAVAFERLCTTTPDRRSDIMILIAYDGSEDAKAAIRHAGKLMPGFPATVLTIWEPFTTLLARTPEVLRSLARVDDADEIDRESADDAETVGEGGRGARTRGRARRHAIDRVAQRQHRPHDHPAGRHASMSMRSWSARAD